MEKDLLYKPSLTYDKNYYTEGELYDVSDNISVEESIPSDNYKDKIDLLEKEKNELLSKLPLLPNSIQGIIKPSIDLIGSVVDDLANNKNNIFSNYDNPIIGVIPVHPPDDGDPDPDDVVPGPPGGNNDPDPEDVPRDPFGSEPTSTITIYPKEIDPGKDIEKQYLKDLSDILGDYLKKQNMAIQNYINGILTYASYAENNNMKNYTSKTIKNQGLTHVTDYITKSKIGLKQQVKLYNKLFTIDETIYHLRAVKVSKEQLKRYKLNKKIEDKNLLTQSANSLLIESRLIAEKKYEENFYGLYKYLNSSVIIFSECMNIYVKQKRSLILLNNEERE